VAPLAGAKRSSAKKAKPEKDFTKPDRKASKGAGTGNASDSGRKTAKVKGSSKSSTKAGGASTRPSVPAKEKRNLPPSSERRKKARAEKFGAPKQTKTEVAKESGDRPAKVVRGPEEIRNLQQSARGRKVLRPKAHTVEILSPMVMPCRESLRRGLLHFTGELHELSVVAPGRAYAAEWETARAVRNSRSYSFKSYVGGDEIRFVTRDYLKAGKGVSLETHKNIEGVGATFKRSELRTPQKEVASRRFFAERRKIRSKGAVKAQATVPKGPKGVNARGRRFIRRQNLKLSDLVLGGGDAAVEAVSKHKRKRTVKVRKPVVPPLTEKKETSSASVKKDVAKTSESYRLELVDSSGNVVDPRSLKPDMFGHYASGVEDNSYGIVKLVLRSDVSPTS
jgi:hypothetical protein